MLWIGSAGQDFGEVISCLTSSVGVVDSSAPPLCGWTDRVQNGRPRQLLGAVCRAMVAPSLVSAVVDTPTAAAGLVVEPSSKPGSSSADLVSSLPVVGTLLRQTATWANTHYPFLWWSTQFLGQSAAWGLAWHGLGSLMAKLAWTLRFSFLTASMFA